MEGNKKGKKTYLSRFWMHTHPILTTMVFWGSSRVSNRSRVPEPPVAPRRNEGILLFIAEIMSRVSFFVRCQRLLASAARSIKSTGPPLLNLARPFYSISLAQEISSISTVIFIGHAGGAFSLGAGTRANKRGENDSIASRS